MNAQDRMMGSGGCQLVVGSAITAVDGKAYGASVRVDGTKIMSITQNDGSGDVVVSNKTWQNVTLNNGEFIAFKYPVSSITLNATADSVMLWIEP